MPIRICFLYSRIYTFSYICIPCKKEWSIEWLEQEIRTWNATIRGALTGLHSVSCAIKFFKTARFYEGMNFREGQIFITL